MKSTFELLQKELRTLRRKVTKLEEQRRRQENIADSERSLLKRINEQLCEEIHMRRWTEQSLLESEQRFRTLFEKTPDAIIVVSLQDQILDVNQMGCERLGYTRDEFLRLKITEIDPTIKKFSRKKMILPWLLNNLQLNLEAIHKHKDGHEIPVELNVVKMEIDGKPAILSIARDITHRIENEKIIKGLLDRFSAIFSQSIDGILVADVETCELLFANQATCRMLGYNENELRSMTVSDIHPTGSRSSITTAFKSITNTPSVYLPDAPILHKNGSVSYADINAGFAFIDERPCCIAIFRDMKERKRLEEMRSDVERIIRQDLKAPLNSINNIAQTLLMDKLHHSQLDRIFDIHSIGSRLLKLIDLHNEIQNMEHGTYEPNFEWFDFRVIFKNIERLVSQQAEVKLVRVIHHYADSPNLGKLLFFGEPTLLESMMVNLVLNAVEASPNYSEVTLSYENSPNQVTIAIHNFGMVPEKIRSRFFEKYATFGKPKGTGLGTYSARLIVQAHGGGISFETDAVMGTIVTVNLPYAKTEASGRGVN